MKTIGSDYQDLLLKAQSKNETVPVKVDFQLFVNICVKMFNNSRLTLSLISVVTSVTILGSSSAALALRKGDNSSEVRNVQSCLKRLGYFNGPVNGNFASMTEAAVKKFQGANGIPAIGVVGPQTQAALQRNCGGSGDGVPSNNCQSQLRSGCDGAAVRTLQRDLTTLGVYNGPITGRFGELTKNAVIRFQQQNGINPIGVVGPRTREAIRLRLRGGTQPSEPPVSSGRFCDYRTEVISIGCRSEWVRQMQQRLKDLGYFTGNPTGYFGEMTRSSVVSFQQNNRLPVTGIVDSATWRLISSSNPVPPLPSDIFLGPGSRGPQVTTLQQQLKQLGYFYGNPTGSFDRSTQEAVMRFQESYGLPMTGNVDPVTFQTINQVLPPNIGGPSNFQPLQVGDDNEKVKKLQEALAKRGLLTVIPTGYFGNLTRNAVIAFQNFERLPATGVVDEQTWKRLGFSISREKRYVVVIPLRNPDIFNRVRQLIPGARVEESRRGKYVNAGEYNQRSEAQRQSEILRDRDFDARVDYF
jgi:peptidoglycan hydrolase-like protein with peptidoglycan-binding domain